MKKAMFFAVLAFLVAAAYFAWEYSQREAALRERVRQLQEIVGRLNAEYRVAQVIVLGQEAGPDGKLRTAIEFREIGRDNQPLPPITATLVGQEVYFEVLLIKFQNPYVEMGDALRGKSLILFRRMFGSATAPDDGVPIDPNASDGVPSVYRVAANPSPLEVEIWSRFWYLANHPDEAKKLGVRVIQLEAIGTRVEPHGTYQIDVENDGGMNIVPITLPAK